MTTLTLLLIIGQFGARDILMPQFEPGGTKSYPGASTGVRELLKVTYHSTDDFLTGCC